MQVHLNLEVETEDQPTYAAIEVACDALRMSGMQVQAGHWHEVVDEVHEHEQH